MIILALLQSIYFVIKFVFDMLPDLPAIPTSVIDLSNSLATFLAGGFGVVMHIFTPPLTIAIVLLTIALLVFDQVWYLTRYILRLFKIPA